MKLKSTNAEANVVIFDGEMVRSVSYGFRHRKTRGVPESKNVSAFLDAKC